MKLTLHKLNNRQAGASLIEVLVAVLLLSFGILALGTLLSFSVQMPKLAAYRATATNLASSHIERIRANTNGDYTSSLSYDGTFAPISTANCAPTCTAAELWSYMDKKYTESAARAELPAGGLMVTCDTIPSSTVKCPSGSLWVMWQEPSTVAEINSANSDNCPPEVTSFHPMPRCLYVKFRI